MRHEGQDLPVFVEMPVFQRHREEYLSDESYRRFQALLIANPESGALIRHSGGLRKLRFEDARRGKGRRGGLRIIYYFWTGGSEIWLFTVYGKDEMADLSDSERNELRRMLGNELHARSVCN